MPRRLPRDAAERLSMAGAAGTMKRGPLTRRMSRQSDQKMEAMLK